MPVNGFDYAKNMIPVYSSTEIDTMNANKQDKAITYTVILLNNAWIDSAGGGFEQNVSATAVSSNNTVIVAPAALSIGEYSAKKVFCSNQGIQILTFKCSERPTNDLTVNVLVL